MKGNNMTIDERIRELGIELPTTISPSGAYATGVREGNLLFTSGQTPRIDGKLRYVGRVGADLTAEEAYQAARICAINSLGIIRQLTGSLDRVARIIKLNGYVSCTADFAGQTQVIDGASELLREIFQENGVSARSAIGVYALPGNAPCEVELIVKLKR